MKINSPGAFSLSGRSRRHRGFTVTEMMVAGTIFGLAVIGILYSHLFGLRMFNIAASKLRATSAARLAASLVRNDVRGAKLMYVGSGDGNHFTSAVAGALRQGNALQIYPTTDTNTFIRYYLDSTNQILCRVRSDSPQIKLMAANVTNQIPFALEDYGGNILTNDVNNRVARITLDFYQWDFLVVGPQRGAGYDHYRLQTRVTRRAIE